jgi:hypothetical protein
VLAQTVLFNEVKSPNEAIGVVRVHTKDREPKGGHDAE